MGALGKPSIRLFDLFSSHSASQDIGNWRVHALYVVRYAFSSTSQVTQLFCLQINCVRVTDRQSEQQQQQKNALPIKEYTYMLY